MATHALRDAMTKRVLSRREAAEQLIARRFSELPPDFQKGSATVTAEIGLRPWDELDFDVRRNVVQRVRQVEQRRAAGRYTLGEAARAIVRHVAARDDVRDRSRKTLTYSRLEWRVASKLIASAKTGEFLVYLSGEPVSFPPDDAAVSSWLSREAYWNDLNRWLERNEPALEFEFPAPQRDAGDAGVGTPADRGVARVATNTPIAETEPSALAAEGGARDDKQKETLEERNARIVARCNELKVKDRRRDWQKQVALEENLSKSTIKKILRQCDEPNAGATTVGPHSIFRLPGKQHSTK
ncbi:hypothetical protein PQQ99_22430 [Paraburkholderia sediminicola]|uniref:hypothetical protein n=1 Tax=Paraburkholderia sediminicola TaxID=458836 RepID=UPI0038BC6507